jgi:hypothetical protein
VFLYPPTAEEQAATAAAMRANAEAHPWLNRVLGDIASAGPRLFGDQPAAEAQLPTGGGTLADAALAQAAGIAAFPALPGAVPAWEAGARVLARPAARVGEAVGTHVGPLLGGATETAIRQLVPGAGFGGGESVEG